MNSNLNRALSVALVAFGGVAPALAQYDWDGHCIDPTNTYPYSIPFIFDNIQTKLFGAAIGAVGTVAYGSQCESASAPIAGRIGFTIGPVGSIQDQDPNQDFGGATDNHLRLTAGTNFEEEIIPTNSYPGYYASPSVGGLSYARIYVQDQTTGATTNYLYNANGNFFEGRSGRYMYSEARVDGTDPLNSVYVRCVIDVLGDAARVHWTLTNNLNLNTAGSTGTNAGLGLWFGQEVALIDQFGQAQFIQYGNRGIPTTYVTIPGRKPLTVGERFPPDAQEINAGDFVTTVPPYVNFSESQVAGFGLQVVNSPTALDLFDPTSVADQTPVDEFAFGEAPFLIDGHYGTTDPQFGSPQDGSDIFNPPGNGNADAPGVGGFTAYIQKWQPNVVVAPKSSRDIIAYYRSTSGDSNYGQSFTGYTAVVDTPKVISTSRTDPSTFANSPFTIEVNVDNTGGYSNVDTFTAMESVEVVLNLPPGMHDANDPTQQRLVKTVSRINAQDIAAVDFKVAVDRDAFGSLPYSVTITPQNFDPKTVTGVINVATAPRLVVRPAANLLSPPWTFADPSWEAVLELGLNTDFQAYTWDAPTQQYIPQVAAERGVGTFIVSNADQGSRALGGSPREPDDQLPDPTNIDVGGAHGIPLRAGWNLVGNPYNFSFDIGQLVILPVGVTQALTYSQAVSQNFTDGGFVPYDPLTRTYLSAISGAGSRLQPNAGYWIYANSAFTLQFPPIYDLFVRTAPPAPLKQRFDNWQLQLSAAQSGASDQNTFVGLGRTPDDVKVRTLRKTPISPAPNAVRAFVSGDPRWGNASLTHGTRGKQTYTYNVFANAAGPMTVSWPNLKAIPSNLAVTLKDNVTGKTVNARSSTGYSYVAGAKTSRSFTVTVTPQGTVAQRVASASVTTTKHGPIAKMKIVYGLSGRGSATLRAYQGSTLVGVIASDVDAAAGANSVTWPMIGSNGLPLPNGTYTLEIAATGEGGDTATRRLSILVRH